MALTFYTMPPVEYPFLLSNIKHKPLFKQPWVKHAILDAGVMVFLNATLQDYPQNFYNEYFAFAKTLPHEFWIVIPDFPDDYHPGKLQDNIEKTNENIRKYLNDDLNYLPVLQAKYLNKPSYYENCIIVRDLIEQYPRIAIGTVCKCNNIGFIKFCARVTRQVFPHAHIHAFGLTAKALPVVKRYINSFDSCAWSFPRGRGRASCRNKTERVQYFYDYLNSIQKFIQCRESAVPRSREGAP